MTTIPESITKAINENLPGLVGTQLQMMLAEATANKDRVASLTEDNQSLRGHLQKARGEIEKLQAANHELMQLAAKEGEIRAREMRLELTITEAKLVSAEKSKQDLFTLVGVLFKNPITKESVIRGDTSYGPAGSSSCNGSETIIREVE